MVSAPSASSISGSLSGRGARSCSSSDVDRLEQLRLALAGGADLFGDPLEEGADLGLGVTAERRREAALHDLVGGQLRSARDHTPPVGLSHLSTPKSVDTSPARLVIVVSRVHANRCNAREPRLLASTVRRAPGSARRHGNLRHGRTAGVAQDLQRLGQRRSPEQLHALSDPFARGLRDPFRTATARVVAALRHDEDLRVRARAATAFCGRPPISPTRPFGVDRAGDRDRACRRSARRA